MAADLMHFQGKTGPLFPVQEPPLFLGHTALLGIPDVPDDLLDPSVFHVQRKAAKLHGFFPVKTFRFKKYRIKTIIVERIGTISTGTSRTRIRPGNLPSENGSVERVNQATLILTGKGMPVRRNYAVGFLQGLFLRGACLGVRQKTRLFLRGTN